MRILITGVSGLLGNNLAYYLKDTCPVLGLYGSHPVSIPGIRAAGADILSLSSLKKHFTSFRPDTVIHCASLTNVDECERDQLTTRAVNVIGTRNVVQALRPQTRLVYISTDSVYDGAKGGFKESGPVAPQNYYGISKFEGELEVLKRKGSLVLRTNIFGWNIRDKFSIAEWLLHELEAKRPVKGFKDAYFSSIYTMELARLLEAALKKGLSGIYNCASRDACSKYEFACRLAERFGLDASLIKPISIDDFGFSARRGKNLSLNTAALSRALGRHLPSIRDSIDRFYKDYKAGIPAAIKKENKPSARQARQVIPYGWHSIDDQDILSVVEVLRSKHITQGPKIREFEEALCAYTGAKYAVCVSSGTAALHLACLAAGIAKGDEVITSAVTFVASANCVLYCSGKPVLADILPGTANIDPDQIRRKITSRTKALIPVHFAGAPCDLKEIRAIARKHGLRVIEDAAHALGAEYQGSRIGSCAYSDMTVLSFHPVKSITTGEGGAVLTNDVGLFERLCLLRNHGITKDRDKFTGGAGHPRDDSPWYYQMQELGFNYRITDIQAALGLSQLEKIDAFISRRRQIAGAYHRALSGLTALRLPAEQAGASSSWHLYVVQLTGTDGVAAERKKLFEYLHAHAIGAQVHYIPVYLHPYYQRRIGATCSDFPVANDYYSRCLTIPLYPRMSSGDIALTVETLKNYFDENSID